MKKTNNSLSLFKYKVLINSYVMNKIITSYIINLINYKTNIRFNNKKIKKKSVIISFCFSYKN